jgi:hypothetical protein
MGIESPDSLIAKERRAVYGLPETATDEEVDRVQRASIAKEREKQG